MVLTNLCCKSRSFYSKYNPSVIDRDGLEILKSWFGADPNGGDYQIVLSNSREKRCSEKMTSY